MVGRIVIDKIVSIDMVYENECEWREEWPEERERERVHVQGTPWTLDDMNWWYDEDYRPNGRQPNSVPRFRDTTVKPLSENTRRGRSISRARDVDLRLQLDNKRRRSPSLVERAHESERHLRRQELPRPHARVTPSSNDSYDVWARVEASRLRRERQEREDLETRIAGRGRRITIQSRSPSPRPGKLASVVVKAKSVKSTSIVQTVGVIEDDVIRRSKSGKNRIVDSSSDNSESESEIRAALLKSASTHLKGSAKRNSVASASATLASVARESVAANKGNSDSVLAFSELSTAEVDLSVPETALCELGGVPDVLAGREEPLVKGPPPVTRRRVAGPGRRSVTRAVQTTSTSGDEQERKETVAREKELLAQQVIKLMYSYLEPLQIVPAVADLFEIDVSGLQLPDPSLACGIPSAEGDEQDWGEQFLKELEQLQEQQSAEEKARLPEDLQNLDLVGMEEEQLPHYSPISSPDTESASEMEEQFVMVERGDIE